MKRLIAKVVPEKAMDAWWDWRRASSLSPEARAIVAQDRQPLPTLDVGAKSAIEASIRWLERAQDCSLTHDGGVARHFSLLNGWAESYPETTGYIIPTFITAARALDQPQLLGRARRMLDWLVVGQLAGGGIRGGRVHQLPEVPVTFNTGQVLLGLAAGAKEFDEPRYWKAMRGAAEFLRDSQDPDGAWRRHPTPFAARGDKTYETHVAWGLFEAHRIAPNEGFGEAGLRQARWALTRQTGNGWFRDNCLNNPNAPLTHTIGYALRGIIEAYRLSREEVFLAAAVRTAEALVKCTAQDGFISGRLNANWRPSARYVCLTGSVQIAACWFLLAQLTGRAEFDQIARRVNSFVRRTLRMEGDSNLVGGVKGSHPIDGEYGRFEYLNWAAKFLIDANLLELGHSLDMGSQSAGR